jgi:hypothetical protein
MTYVSNRGPAGAVPATADGTGPGQDLSVADLLDRVLAPAFRSEAVVVRLDVSFQIRLLYQLQGRLHDAVTHGDPGHGHLAMVQAVSPSTPARHACPCSPGPASRPQPGNCGLLARPQVQDSGSGSCLTRAWHRGEGTLKGFPPGLTWPVDGAAIGGRAQPAAGMPRPADQTAGRTKINDVDRHQDGRSPPCALTALALSSVDPQESYATSRPSRTGWQPRGPYDEPAHAPYGSRPAWPPRADGPRH